MTKSEGLENVKCPVCEGPMISRKGQYGTFWGCKNYPECKGTRDSMGRSKEERGQYKSEMADKEDDMTSKQRFAFRRDDK